jgi:hypothetical protein
VRQLVPDIGEVLPRARDNEIHYCTPHFEEEFYQACGVHSFSRVTYMLQILERELTRVSRDDLTVEVLTWRVRMDEYYRLLSNTVDCLEEGLECCVSQVIALVVKQQTNTDGSQLFDCIICFGDAALVSNIR